MDDEVDQLNLMSRFLERKGFRVLTARDGIEAVEIHSRHKDEIAVVIMDMALPKPSGTDAFLTLQEARQDVKTIFATGYITPEERLKLIGQGAVDILEKPYLPENFCRRSEPPWARQHSHSRVSNTLVARGGEQIESAKSLISI